MAADLVQHANHAAEALEAQLQRRWTPILLALSIALGYGALAALVGIGHYSPDSWSYLELARTVFSGDFFAVNTIRSYLPYDHAASFPPAYPVALALLQRLVGPRPEVGVWLDVGCAAATAIVLLRMADRARLPRLAALVLACAILLYPGYVEEVFAGRSMPLAVLFFALGVLAHLRGATLLCGLALGLGALTRFDFLVFGLAVQGMALVLERAPRAALWRLGGFFLGCLPWIVYSRHHFGAWWFSDNGWVTFSVTRAHVLDYPAQALLRAGDAPAAWLARVGGNAKPLFKFAAYAAFEFPLLPVLALLSVLHARRFDRPTLLRVALALGALGLCTAPYLLTGYLYIRYLTILFAVAAALLLLAAGRLEIPLYRVALLLALLATLGTNGPTLASDVRAGMATLALEPQQQARIAALRACHAAHPDAILLFTDAVLAARYGAETGRRAAMLPANLPAMTAEARQGYFAHMSPYLLIDGHSEAASCGLAVLKN